MSIIGKELNNWLEKHEPQSISTMGSGLIDWATESLLGQEEGETPMLNVQETERRLQELKQPTKEGESNVCKIMPDESVRGMISMTVESARLEKEMGAAIKPGLSLGGAQTGTENQVKIKRTRDTEGTFHTHVRPGGIVQPSPQDILDALAKKDKVMCVGATGLEGVQINCFTPVEPLWSKYREEMIKLLSDLKDYYQEISNKYGVSHKAWDETTQKYVWAAPVIGAKVRAPTLKRLLKYIASPEYASGIASMKPQDMTLIQLDATNKAQRARRFEEAVTRAESELAIAEERVTDAQGTYDAALEFARPDPNSFLTIGTKVFITVGGHAGQVGVIQQIVPESTSELTPAGKYYRCLTCGETMEHAEMAEHKRLTGHDEYERITEHMYTKRGGGKTIRIIQGPPGELRAGTEYAETGEILYRILVDHETITRKPYEFVLLTEDVSATRLALYRAEEDARRLALVVEQAKAQSDNAAAEAEIARLKSYTRPGDISEGQQNARWAAERLQKGSQLELRRQELIDSLHDHVLFASYKPEERGKRPMAVAKCNLVGIEEEAAEPLTPEERAYRETFADIDVRDESQPTGGLVIKQLGAE